MTVQHEERPTSVPERQTHVFETNLAGRPFSIEIGKVAQQANGACIVRYGDTVVLVTATASAEPREGVDFFPLTVDVEERLYAVGRIPGSWGRREGRPPEKAILMARLTDRPIRPLFPEGFRNDVQVVVTVLSVDHDHSPEVAGMIGASVALVVSDIPFSGPIGAVEVGRVDGRIVINPTSEESSRSDLSLIVAGTRDAVLMVEAGAKEVPEEDIIEAIMAGHREIKSLVEFQERIRESVGKPKREVQLFEPDASVDRQVREYVTQRIRDAIVIADKSEREAALDNIQAEAKAHFEEVFPEKGADVEAVLRRVLREEVRKMVTERGVRPDGRGPDDIRPVSCEVALLPRTHGSGLFTRGQTQVLSVATLGAVSDVQELDTISEEEFKKYIHHYNFPPYSTGETRPLRGPGRREIGHGALAERALLAVLPPDDEFPYTIRVVSEVLSSNGSTSMASVCGSTLALMDAGVPIRAPVSGVAMGLVKEGESVVVLTDIQGMEDALGDMDFKVAGTQKGVTALQMDIKIAGVDRAILETALHRAREARLAIMKKMLEAIPAPRPELSPYAPRIVVIEIDPEKIRDVIGPGGKVINKIIAETNAKIDIEQDGKVYIAAADSAGGEKAVKMIRALTRDVEVGAEYLGKVTRITNFGAFIEILPGKEGLVRLSEISDERIRRVEDVLNVGDEVLVKVTEIDRLGRINLSRRAAMAQKDGDRGDNRDDHRRPRNEPRRGRRWDHGDNPGFRRGAERGTERGGRA
ncbi:MAG: polyribonucleotide nucleotidyltransferase [Firmicutes bacterium]|jgi:polyribonucleotide nucleotidyltransferase|nr:polyribonucleotide nucleotidyltransferase [Bacillota bacterium]